MQSFSPVHQKWETAGVSKRWHRLSFTLKVPGMSHYEKLKNQRRKPALEPALNILVQFLIMGGVSHFPDIRMEPAGTAEASENFFRKSPAAMRGN